jgi:G3E family GTPase
MNNGCICCTVRGDLIRILGNLLKRRDRFDAILIETTGLADPGPVAQTFFVDDFLDWMRSSPLWMPIMWVFIWTKAERCRSKSPLPM